MPCSDGGPSAEQVREERGTPAVWCAVMRVLEAEGILGRVLDSCDWDEAGVTREEAVGWWAGHKRRDAERRAWEADARRKEELAAHARQKLSPEEREALGLREPRR